MLNFPMNKEIARRYFAALILDYEYPAADGLPPLVICRVLIDGYFHSKIRAATINEAIEIFNNNEWRF